MATRPQIGQRERLFRKLRALHVEGKRVLPEAIDLQGSSCDREHYRSEPYDLVDADWPAVAYTISAKLPTRVKPEGAQVSWDFFVVDAPEPSNPAHCEIRIRRTDRTSAANDNAIRGKPPLVREAVKVALASTFDVLPPRL